MRRQQAFKYELMPNGEQQRNMRRFAGSRRFVFNKALALQKANADVVGALNVLARGHRVAACGEEGSGQGRKTRTKPASVKQEPTEATMREVTHA